MKKRLVIITEIIAPYRIPVFNALTRRDDVDPYIIFLSETDSSLREWEIPKQEIEFSYEVLPSFRRRLGKYNVLVNRGVTRALRDSSPDVLICGGYSYVASWQAASWCRRNQVPLVLWVESTSRDRRRGYRGVEHLKKRFITLSDRFVVPGRSAAEYLRTFGVTSDSIYHAPNAVDTELFATTPLMHTKPDPRLPERFFLYVGRLVREKGVFDLLAAYEKLTPEVRDKFGLVVAGNGVERSHLEQRARSIRPGTIVFTGFQQKDELASLYARAHALIFPTHSDPWGLVVNEAMACGLPIIATSVAGCVADLVEDGWNGRITPSGNVSQLAAAMDSLAHNPEAREAMSANSRARSRKYSPEACAHGLAQAATAMEFASG
jgi:glycosyltransferase involved in cell wall biosynthesis